MTTSGTTAFRMTLREIVDAAALEVGARREGQTLSAQTDTEIKLKLNAMIKAWGADGIRVWTTREGVLVPAAATAKYTVGDGGTAHIADGDDFFQTTLSAAAASGATTLSVASLTNIAASDFIGIVLDDGTVHWTTVSGAPSSTVALTTGLAGAAASGNAVFTYTTKISKPLGVPEARRQSIATGHEVPISMWARMDYKTLSNKAQAGTPNILWYDPGEFYGTIHLHAVPATVTDLVRFTYRRALQDNGVNSSDVDFPPEWSLALIYNLAKLLATTYPVSDGRYGRIVAEAGTYLDLVRGHDREQESIYFGVDLEG